MGTQRTKHAENRNKTYKEILCTNLALFTRLTGMHGQQNTKRGVILSAEMQASVSEPYS
jgi:hypothetical protein